MPCDCLLLNCGILPGVTSLPASVGPYAVQLMLYAAAFSLISQSEIVQLGLAWRMKQAEDETSISLTASYRVLLHLFAHAESMAGLVKQASWQTLLDVDAGNFDTISCMCIWWHVRAASQQDMTWLDMAYLWAQACNLTECQCVTALCQMLVLLCYKLQSLKHTARVWQNLICPWQQWFTLWVLHNS